MVADGAFIDKSSHKGSVAVYCAQFDHRFLEMLPKTRQEAALTISRFMPEATTSHLACWRHNVPTISPRPFINRQNIRKVNTANTGDHLS